MWQTTRIETQQQPSAFSDSHIRFLWVTDSHLVSVQQARDNNLRLAVQDCNEWRPDALIHTGDLGDNNLYRVQYAFNDLKLCQRPVYSVIGNHDEDEQASPGSPNTALLQGFDTFNRFPFYYTNAIASGDGSLTARCLYLDCNTYNTYAGAPTIVNPSHSPGERVGYSTDEPSGGSYRQFTTAQLDWITAQLAADTTSQIVLVFPHYPPGGQTCTDYVELADILQADGRPTAFFCGHVHPDAKTYTLTSTDTLATFTIYKTPALMESGCWTRAEIHLAAGAIVIDQLLVQNFTDPGGWTINAPFSV